MPVTVTGERVTVSTALPAASARVSVKVENPIVTIFTLVMVHVAMFAVPRLPLGRPAGEPRETVKVSEASARRSSIKATAKVTWVSLEAKVASTGGVDVISPDDAVAAKP